LSYSGYLYIQRDAEKSGLVPFKFNPTLQVLNIGVTNDKRITAPGDSDAYCMVTHIGALDFFGHKGDDEFFLNTRLKNGWVVDSVLFAANPPLGNGNASVVDSRIGTISPYVKVHWWIDAFSSQCYQLSVNIRGPSGVAYQ